MNEVGFLGYVINGFNENLLLFQQGKCGMWIDVMVVVFFVINLNDFIVVDYVGFVLVLDIGFGKWFNWLWVWVLVILVGMQKVDVVKQFIEWVILKEYIEFVVVKEGWVNVFLGVCMLFYVNFEYQKVLFVQMMLDSINVVDLNNLMVKLVLYVGIQFVVIFEFVGIVMEVSQEFLVVYVG